MVLRWHRNNSMSRRPQNGVSSHMTAANFEETDRPVSGSDKVLGKQFGQHTFKGEQTQQAHEDARTECHLPVACQR